MLKASEGRPPEVSPRGAGDQHTGHFSKELINDVAYFGGSANKEQPLDAQPGQLRAQQVLQVP